jgi:hypothetical protein
MSKRCYVSSNKADSADPYIISNNTNMWLLDKYVLKYDFLILYTTRGSTLPLIWANSFQSISEK